MESGLKIKWHNNTNKPTPHSGKVVYGE